MWMWNVGLLITVGWVGEFLIRVMSSRSKPYFSLEDSPAGGITYMVLLLIFVGLIGWIFNDFRRHDPMEFIGFPRAVVWLLTYLVFRKVIGLARAHSS